MAVAAAGVIGVAWIANARSQTLLLQTTPQAPARVQAEPERPLAVPQVQAEPERPLAVPQVQPRTRAAPQAPPRVQVQPRTRAAPQAPSVPSVKPERRLQVDVVTLYQRLLALEARVRDLEKHTHKYNPAILPGINATLTVREIRGDNEEINDYAGYFGSPDAAWGEHGDPWVTYPPGHDLTKPYPQ
jgi:hypothetical protein